MKKIGIICEINPLHKGHIHFINTIKERYPDSLLILVLGGYFLQRGDVSLISKWNKTELALNYGVDLVLELPTVYNTNSADYFAYYSIKILNEVGIDTLIFGSESDDLDKLKNVALSEEELNFNLEVRSNLRKGLNYPTSLSKCLNINLESNDILGVAYLKAILKINKNIKVELVKRTNSFNDVTSNEDVVSASNIREKLRNGTDITRFIPVYNSKFINSIDEDKLFELLRYRIITDSHLNQYLGVDEGLENRLKNVILVSNNYSELLNNIKSKRYTTSRLKRMLIHILLGIEKDDIKEDLEEYRIIGFNSRGKKYLHSLNNPKFGFKSSSLENRASLMYYELTHDESIKYESLNKPIIKD